MVIGTYGTMAYWVRQRVPEIAIRAALGAERRHLLNLVSRQVTVLAGYGCALGTIAAAVAGLAIDLPLYGVTALDVTSFGTAILALAGAATAAGVYPAMRAMRVSPTVALRRT